MPEEIKLIQPAPIVRDENGMFAHPDMPDFDEGDGDKCRAWVAEQALEVTMVSLEYHSDEAVSERYFEAGDPDCSYWEPDRPDGEGWFCLAIHDTDDGPVCWWARRAPGLQRELNAVVAGKDFCGACGDGCGSCQVVEESPQVTP